MPQREVHFNVEEELFKRFERALRKSGWTTKSEYFRFAMRQLAETVEASAQEFKGAKALE